MSSLHVLCIHHLAGKLVVLMKASLKAELGEKLNAEEKD